MSYKQRLGRQNQFSPEQRMPGGDIKDVHNIMKDIDRGRWPVSVSHGRDVEKPEDIGLTFVGRSLKVIDNG